MVAGGTGLYGQELSDIEVFDPAADGGLGGWYSLGDLPGEDDYHTSSTSGLLYNEKYLIYLAYDDTIWLSDESFSSWTKFGDFGSGYCLYCDQRAAMIPEDFFFK